MRTVKIPCRRSIRLESIRDVFGLSGEWELCAWPISYNGSISFIFRNTEEGDVAVEGMEEVYHFKVFIVSDFNFTQVQKKDVALTGLALVSIFFWQHGYAAVVRDKVDNTFVILYNEQGAVVSRIAVGQDVCRLMVTRDGRVAVGYATGYAGNYRKEASCFVVFTATGQKLYACNEDSARACMDLTIDAENNVWASCFPDVAMYKVMPTGQVEKIVYPVASPDGLIPLKLNGQDAVIQMFSYEECYAPINYLCTREGLLQVEFGEIEAQEIVSSSAYAGRAVLLTADNELQFFDLSDINRALG